MFRFVVALAAGAACLAQEPQSHQKLIPTLWVQTSEEYRGLALQSYRLARIRLDEALRDKRWTAAAQTGNYGKLPPAVYLDIDETVLDNSPSLGREIRDAKRFNLDDWAKWVAESAAAAVPGALEFCRYAASRKVAVYYVSNRDAAMEEATRANLARLGFPLDDRVDTVLLRGEQPEWGSDKSTRLAHVAQRHRVLLIVGDDLNDFLEGARAPVKERATLMRDKRAKWGREWILIPNPGYGSWEEALYGVPRPETPEERLQKKLEHVRVD